MMLAWIGTAGMFVPSLQRSRRVAGPWERELCGFVECESAGWFEIRRTLAGVEVLVVCCGRISWSWDLFLFEGIVSEASLSKKTWMWRKALTLKN